MRKKEKRQKAGINFYRKADKIQEKTWGRKENKGKKQTEKRKRKGWVAKSKQSCSSLKQEAAD